MSTTAWDLIASPLNRDDPPWELFHENSKTNPREPSLPEEVAQAYAGQMPESLVFESYQEVALPEISALPPVSLLHQAAVPELEPCSVTLEAAAALLRYGYGVASDEAPETPRRRRAVYSAGSVFPLEIFVHCSHVVGVSAGIYHYYPPGNSLRFLRGGDQSQKLAPGLLDGRVAQTAAMIVFIAAMPERSVFRYGDRGYRFALLEAGAVVQNINLTCGALGLACVNIGEYFDRQIDNILNLDGLTISTLYMVGIGKAAGDQAAHGGRTAGDNR